MSDTYDASVERTGDAIGAIAEGLGAEHVPTDAEIEAENARVIAERHGTSATASVEEVYRKKRREGIVLGVAFGVGGSGVAFLLYLVLR